MPEFKCNNLPNQARVNQAFEELFQTMSTNRYSPEQVAKMEGLLRTLLDREDWEWVRLQDLASAIPVDRPNVDPSDIANQVMAGPIRNIGETLCQALDWKPRVEPVPSGNTECYWASFLNCIMDGKRFEFQLNDRARSALVSRRRHTEEPPK